MHPANHQEYVLAYMAGRVKAGINESIALRLAESLPRRYQIAHTFWSWVWILSFPCCIAVSIFFKWWVGILLLMIVPAMISRSIKQSACQFVLKRLLEDQIFYESVVNQRLIEFRWK